MRKKIVSAVIAIVAIGICNAHSLFFYFLPLKVERNEALNKLDVPSHPSCQKCDGENFLYFDINVQQDDNYFLGFWLLPARYADGSFTIYKVYVNNEYVGNLNPKKDGWQNATLDNEKKLR